MPTSQFLSQYLDKAKKFAQNPIPIYGLPGENNWTIDKHKAELTWQDYEDNISFIKDSK